MPCRAEASAKAGQWMAIHAASERTSRLPGSRSDGRKPATRANAQRPGARFAQAAAPHPASARPPATNDSSHVADRQPDRRRHRAGGDRDRQAREARPFVGVDHHRRPIRSRASRNRRVPDRPSRRRRTRARDRTAFARTAFRRVDGRRECDRRERQHRLRLPEPRPASRSSTSAP